MRMENTKQVKIPVANINMIFFGKHKSKGDVGQEKEQNKSYSSDNFWC